MNKDINELNDENLDSIIGGSGTYMTDLSSFLIEGKYGKYFHLNYGKVLSDGSTVKSGLDFSPNDERFARLVSKSKDYGGITFTKSDGSSQFFTTEQLSSML